MQKGHYKCLFCNDVIVWQNCKCDGTNSLRTFHSVCNNNHSLCLKTNSCPRCSKNNDVVLLEGVWFTLFSNIGRTFPGRLTELRFYDYDENKWFTFTKRDLYVQSDAEEIIARYDYFQLQKRDQQRIAILEWLKCAKRIGRHLINKDVACMIAHLLKLEPFVPF